MRQRTNVLALGAMLLMAAPASAQFTTVVAPPKRTAQEEAARIAEVPRDTGRRTALRDMSAWVDSVAGMPAPGTVDAATQVVDSAAGEVVTDSEPKAEAQTERFRDGAKAPDTATPLPAILLLGIAAMTTGATLLATRRRAS